MKRHFFTVGTAVVALLMGTVGSATAETRHFTCDFSGTSVAGVETHLDTNGDGISVGMRMCP